MSNMPSTYKKQRSTVLLDLLRSELLDLQEERRLLLSEYQHAYTKEGKGETARLLRDNQFRIEVIKKKWKGLRVKTK